MVTLSRSASCNTGPALMVRRWRDDVEMTKVTVKVTCSLCGVAPHKCHYSNFLPSNSFTNCGFACPLEAFITWPTKNPSMVVFPARYCSSCFGFAANTSSIIFSSADVSLDCCGRPSVSYTSGKILAAFKAEVVRIFEHLARDRACLHQIGGGCDPLHGNRRALNVDALSL